MGPRTCVGKPKILASAVRNWRRISGSTGPKATKPKNGECDIYSYDRAWSLISALRGEAVFLDFLIERRAVDAQNLGDVGKVAPFGGQDPGDMLTLQFFQR